MAEYGKNWKCYDSWQAKQKLGSTTHHQQVSLRGDHGSCSGRQKERRLQRSSVPYLRGVESTLRRNCCLCSERGLKADIDQLLDKASSKHPEHLVRSHRRARVHGKRRRKAAQEVLSLCLLCSHRSRQKMEKVVIAALFERTGRPRWSGTSAQL